MVASDDNGGSFSERRYANNHVYKGGSPAYGYEYSDTILQDSDDALIIQNIETSGVYNLNLASESGDSLNGSFLRVTDVTPNATFSISGSNRVGSVLSANQDTIDPDGDGEFTHVWEASIDGSTWTQLGSGLTNTVGAEQEGQQIRLTTEYTDGQGFAESVQTEAIEIGYVDNGDAAFTINGKAAVGETLTAQQTGVDPDGDGEFTHVWEASIDGSTWTQLGSGLTNTVGAEQEGQQIRLTTEYTDGQGFAESVQTEAIEIPTTAFLEPTPEVTTEPTPEVTTEPTPEVTTEPTPEVNPEPTPEVNPEPTTEVTTEPTPEVTTEPTLEVTTEPTTEVTPSPSPSPESSSEPSPTPTPDIDQQDDGFTQLSDADDSLTGQANIKLRMLGGNDYLEVTSGNNYANGNMGEDTIILRGGFGEYLGGKDSDTIEVFGAEEGTSVNGNLGEDFITGTVASVTYRGGKDNDLLAVSQGDVWGDKDSDTFRAVSGDGYAVIQDYTIGKDMVEIEMDGSWSNLGDGLMFTDDSGDQLMLLLGISDVEQVTMV